MVLIPQIFLLAVQIVEARLISHLLTTPQLPTATTGRVLVVAMGTLILREKPALALMLPPGVAATAWAIVGVTVYVEKVTVMSVRVSKKKI